MIKSTFIGLTAAFLIGSAAQAASTDGHGAKAPKGTIFVSKQGESLICKEYRPTGTLIRKTGCGTREEWKEMGEE